MSGTTNPKEFGETAGLVDGRHEAIRRAICDELNDKPSHGKYAIDTCEALADAVMRALNEGSPQRCADGSLVHDFEGQSRCPDCEMEGIRG